MNGISDSYPNFFKYIRNKRGKILCFFGKFCRFFVKKYYNFLTLVGGTYRRGGMARFKKALFGALFQS
jgi:hypothetical protein